MVDAKRIWEMMKDESNKACPMSHDGYLKLYQLSPNPDMARSTKKFYGEILVDEAQDMTPAQLDIIQRNYQPKIFVGDPHQQIYTFRGAINAMDRVAATHVFYLTQSFRFGSEIAYQCNSIVNTLKGVHSKAIVGNTNRSSIRGYANGQLAIISRSNCQLFMEAVSTTEDGNRQFWLKRREEESKDLRNGPNIILPNIAITGQVLESNENMKCIFLDEVEDVFILYMISAQKQRNRRASYHREDIKNGFIKSFDSFEMLRRYAKRIPDPEILGKCNIISNYTEKTGEHVKRIRKHLTSLETAEIVFSTAHKSKGLQFDSVKVTEDYLGNLENLDSASISNCEPDEKNLLYVAASRVKKTLTMNETLFELEWKSGRTFAFPAANPFNYYDGFCSPESPPLQTLTSNSLKSGKGKTPSRKRKLSSEATIQEDTPTCVHQTCSASIPAENSWVLRRPKMTICLPYNSETSNNTVEAGIFCPLHGSTVSPSLTPLLGTILKDKGPKSKRGGNNDQQLDNSQKSDPVTEVHADRLNHLRPAFCNGSVTDSVQRLVY